MPYSKTIMEIVFKNKDESPINMGIHNCLADVNQAIVINGFLSQPADENATGEQSAEQSMIQGTTGSKVMLSSTPAAEEGASVHFEKADHLIEEIVSHVFESGPLVTAILQGRKIRALDMIHEHPKPKAKTAEDDTSYLDLI